jgi:hypothetical protein
MKLKLEIRAERAFNKLKEMGVPVRHLGEGWSGRGLFSISGEENYDGVIWADYYMMSDGGYEFGVNPKITKILQHYGLFAEWCNSGVLDVYEG